MSSRLIPTSSYTYEVIAMQLVELFVVSAVLIGRICLSKTFIETSKPDGFSELEAAAINTLTTCHANKDKTIVLVGDFPASFVNKLSSHQLFSLALLDNTRRPKDNINYYQEHNQDTVHQIHIVVMIAPFYKHYVDLMEVLTSAPYYDSMALFLVLGWSGEKKYAGCSGNYETIDFMYNSNLNRILNVNFMCQNRKRGIVIYTSNPFVNKAPEPWQLVKIMSLREYPNFSYYVREYHEHEGICENLHFDKTDDLGRSQIKVMNTRVNTIDEVEKQLHSFRELRRNIKDSTFIQDGVADVRIAANNQQKLNFGKIEHVDIEPFGNRPTMLKKLEGETNIIEVEYSHQWREWQQRMTFFDVFLVYVNATTLIFWKSTVVGAHTIRDGKCFTTQPTLVRGITDRSCTYPHGLDCKFLITQFRGNKSQLRKLMEVIDIYSWYCMCITCFLTVIFFKYFLGQSLLEGVLNLLRVACDIGLVKLPRDTASQIYLIALFFVMLTMEGIFVGNLAALLTQDISVRQVNSIQDLAELNYTIYVPVMDDTLFQDPIFDGRIIELLPNQHCWSFVLRAPWIACLDWGASTLDSALKHNLHVSKDCISIEYVCNRIPWQWSLEERLNNFLKIITGGGIMTRLEAIVVEKRFLEAETEQVHIEPRIMTLDDLGFTFLILGIGLGIASITFTCELLVYRFHHRLGTTQLSVAKFQVKPRLVQE